MKASIKEKGQKYKYLPFESVKFSVSMGKILL